MLRLAPGAAPGLTHLTLAYLNIPSTVVVAYANDPRDGYAQPTERYVPQIRVRIDPANRHGPPAACAALHANLEVCCTSLHGPENLLMSTAAHTAHLD